MLIEIVNVGQPVTMPAKNGKNYSLIELAYKQDGAIKGKKLVSFSNPGVYKTAQTAQVGAAYEITTVKDGEFWQWTAMQVAQGGLSSTPTGQVERTSTPTKSTSTYETKEERAAKQVMIVRQSSISSAIALLNGNGAKKNTTEEALNIARQFEAFVMGTDTPVAKEVDIFEDDIPL